MLLEDFSFSRVRKSSFLPFLEQIQQLVWEKEQSWQTVAKHQLPVELVSAMSLKNFQGKTNVIICGLILHRGSVGAPADSSASALRGAAARGVRGCPLARYPNEVPGLHQQKAEGEGH